MICHHLMKLVVIANSHFMELSGSKEHLAACLTADPGVMSLTPSPGT